MHGLLPLSQTLLVLLILDLLSSMRTKCSLAVLDLTWPVHRSSWCSEFFCVHFFLATPWHWGQGLPEAKQAVNKERELWKLLRRHGWRKRLPQQRRGLSIETLVRLGIWMLIAVYKEGSLLWQMTIARNSQCQHTHDDCLTWQKLDYFLYENPSQEDSIRCLHAAWHIAQMTVNICVLYRIQ